MRTLKIIEHVTLDGVIQNSPENGFPYGDWNAPYRSPEGRDAMLAAHGESFDLLIGRYTYDLWSTFWPKVPSNPMADRINAATKYVVTHRPEGLDWGPAEALGPDLADSVRRLKVRGRPGPHPVGQLHPDLTPARTRPCRRSRSRHQPGPPRHRQTLLRGRNPSPDPRTDRHNHLPDRPDPHHLQAGRAPQAGLADLHHVVGGNRWAGGAGGCRVEVGSGGDVVLEGEVAAAGAPAEGLDVYAEFGAEADRVGEVEAVHAEALLALVLAVRADHLREAEVRRTELCIATALRTRGRSSRRRRSSPRCRCRRWSGSPRRRPGRT